MVGEVVMKTRAKKINILHLPKGVYLINSDLKFGKFIKQ